MSNKYAFSLISEARSRFSVDASDMSMSDWVCKNTTLRGMPFNFRKFPFQKQICDDMHPNLSCMKISQVGLALDLDTPILTDKGWSTMGELQVGELIYAPDGSKTPVTYLSPVYHDHECYELTFCDGEKIVADAGHRWFVHSERKFNTNGRYPKSGRIPVSVEKNFFRSGVLDTKTIAQDYQQEDGRNVFYIPTTAPLQGVGELPLDPYYLGLWLGDGHAYSTNLTAHVTDSPVYVSILENRGFSCRVTSGGETTHTIKPQNAPGEAKVFNQLTALGVLRNKHIPRVYLQASVSDRLELLRGLMDTDGSITKRGRASFYNTNLQLVEDALELIRSLGFKPRIRWKKPGEAVLKNGQEINSKLQVAEVSFVSYADTPIFHLPRKRERQPVTGRRTEPGSRRIVDVRPVPPRPVRCLTVAHPDHLFLAGKALVTTHNTEIQVRKAAAFVTRNRGRTLIFTFPNDEMQKKTSQTRIQPLLNDNKVFNLAKEAGSAQIRSYNIIQIDSSFLLVTGCSEGEATSTPADAVFNDEVDLSPQDKLALFSSRMQASDLKIRQAFSTPTFEGFGISQTFETSDQHEYFVKCDHCNHWQVPLFDKRWVRTPGLSDDIPLMELDQNILDKFRLDLDACYVQCEKCHLGLDLGRSDNRNWVPKYPHRTNSRGYRVRPFSVATLSPGYIIQKLLEYKLKGFLRGWYNTVLGETYQDGDIRLNDGVIESCFGTPVVHNDQARRIPTFIGIDLGLVCHITLLQPKGGSQQVELDNMETVLFETVKADDLIEKIKQLMLDYLIVGGTCDRHPYTPTANELFDLSNGLIVPCEYRGSAEISDKTDTAKCIQANRTDLLDTVANLIRRRRVRLSGFGTQREVIKEHLKDMVRDESPEKPAAWIKLNGQDHYFHSLGFAFTAVKIYTGDYTGPGGARPEVRSTIFIGGVDMSAQQALQGMLAHVHPTKSNFKQGGSFRQGLGLRQP